MCMFADYTMNFGHYNRGNNLQCRPQIQPQSWCTFALTKSTQCVSWLCWLNQPLTLNAIPLMIKNLENLHFYNYAKALLWSCDSDKWSELIKCTSTVKLATIMNNNSWESFFQHFSFGSCNGTDVAILNTNYVNNILVILRLH